MKEPFIYLLIAVLSVCSSHIWSAIKSGCFYGKGTADFKNPLKKYIDNLHRAQTPFWYSLFGALFFATMAIARLYSGMPLLESVITGQYFNTALAALLVTMGASATCGVFYQGFINLGAGKPFIDPDELDKFEIANPFNYTSLWLPKFWHGRNRIWVSALGLVTLCLGLYMVFHI
jgi:hypothetical protein